MASESITSARPENTKACGRLVSLAAGPSSSSRTSPGPPSMPTARAWRSCESIPMRNAPDVVVVVATWLSAAARNARAVRSAQDRRRRPGPVQPRWPIAGLDVRHRQDQQRRSQAGQRASISCLRAAGKSERVLTSLPADQRPDRSIGWPTTAKWSLPCGFGRRKPAPVDRRHAYRARRGKLPRDIQTRPRRRWRLTAGASRMPQKKSTSISP